MPSYFSISVSCAELVSLPRNELPTAKHSVALAQCTPASELNAEFGAFGLTCFVHSLPFQLRIIVLVAVSVLYCPTAMQLDVVRQCTDVSELEIAPDGFGALTAAHLLPFHRSIIRNTPFGESCTPTATHIVVVGHDTELRWPYNVPGAVGTTRHAVAAPAGAPSETTLAATIASATPARAKAL
jgi:hypothetical protein